MTYEADSVRTTGRVVLSTVKKAAVSMRKEKEYESEELRRSTKVKFYCCNESISVLATVTI